MLFDSHAHLDLGGRTTPQTEAMLERAWEAGLSGILAIAGSARVGLYQNTLQMAEAEPRIWAAAGIHPHAASEATPGALAELRDALRHPRVVALGETGLDYHYNRSPPKEQRAAFVAQVAMAREAGLPLIIHSREAEDDTLAILRGEGAAEVGGVIHCFSSTWPLAEGALDLGFHLSFSGILTFPNAGEVREVAIQTPLERALIETDSPYLAPVPKRKFPNEPARVAHVAARLAELRGLSVEELGRVTCENTRRCFRMDLDRT